MAPPKYPPLAPENIRAVVTTKWTSGYRAVALTNIESYRVDSQLDQDSDSFEITFGDPTNQMRATLNRDNEIRIQLYGLGQNIVYLHTGIVDDVEYDEENRLVMTGRDLSSVATDTDAFAAVFRHRRVDDVIKQRAYEIGMKPQFALTPTRVRPKLSTDGSETEWEFWYRMVRTQSQWLWFTPEGFLTSGPLNYGGPPTYYFGTPDLKDSGDARKKWIPVERVGYKKSTQGRVGRWIMWYKDKKGKSVHREEPDPTIDDWIRKPLKYKEDAKIHSDAGAKQNLQEEIFETKVGALEIRITIPDVGTLIRQNSIARLRIPELDINNDWFVVGSTILADTEGFTQQVRLREKGYAISKRIPTEPQPADPGKPPGATDCPSLQGIIPNHPDWIDCFLSAARKKGKGLAVNWVFFAAVLIGIAEHETGFQNERSHYSGDMGKGSPCKNAVRGPGAHVEYFPLPLGGDWPPGEITNTEQWFTAFANNCGDPHVEGEYAAGPMQLFTRGLKEAADRLTGPVNQFSGGRWDACSNIEIAAGKLAGCAQTCGVAGDSDPDHFWGAVACYGGQGCTPDSVAQNIRSKVMGAGGWYEVLKEALAGCPETEKTAKKGYKNPYRDAEHLTMGRVDMGVDCNASDGSPIYAIGPAKIIQIQNGGWLGNSRWSAVGYAFIDGDADGYSVFVAEYITPVAGLQEGDIVDADTVICHFQGASDQGPAGSYNGNGIESGWSALGTSPAALSVYPGGGRMTSCGVNFDALCQALGVPAGKHDHPPAVACCSNYPKW